jgi:rfaE bifunctional protein nucleotidyltransferase chain/domain
MSRSLEDFLNKNLGKRIVFTNGCFDIIHSGHVSYLVEAKALGDLLIVGLNSDKSVSRLKGPDRPVVHEQDRKFILENLKPVDHVEIFDEETPLELIKKIKPTLLVKGGDYEINKIVGYSEVLSWGGSVKTLEFKLGKSTSSIIDKIRRI